MHVEGTNYLIKAINQCLSCTKQHVTPICIVSVCGLAAHLQNAGLYVHVHVRAC